MRITFIGATGTVTGSKYLLEHKGEKILIDCGLFQGLKELRLRNWEKLPFDPAELNAVVLTHAHIDHSGYIPVLVKRGFTGPIYCTSATRALCGILLPDAGKLQEEEAGYANKKGYTKHSPALPLYTAEDAERSLRYFRSIDYDREFMPRGEWRVQFRRAGHILGAAFVFVSTPRLRLVFSGDVGRPTDPLLLPPEAVETADYLVVESTYGNRIHEADDPLKILEEVIHRTHHQGCTIVIPAFSVGRSQTLLYHLSQLKRENRIPHLPIFLDSPMSIDATDIFCRYQGEHRLSPDQCRALGSVAKYATTQEDSMNILKHQGAKIIISASGMATGGRVLHHLKNYASNPRNVILFTGYQAEGTRGDSLVRGAKTVKIHGEWVPVNAQILVIHGMSAHADQREMLNWLSLFQHPPKRTFVTHGEPAPAHTLRDEIEKRLHWKCEVPKYLERVELG